MDDADTSSEPPSTGQRPCATFELLDPRGLLTPGQREAVCAHAAAALGELEAPGDVRARVVDDAEMTAAHLRHQGLDGTTDVLTFDLSDEPGALDADLLVCIDEARRQAGKRGHRPEIELLLYIIHGVLHCLGHGDATDEAAARMHAEEDRVLSAIGVGPVFARQGGRP